MRYSYCCGKPVRRNEDVKVRGEGYYCDRCKREITLYGNPKSESDKLALKEERAVKGRGHKVLPNGDLHLIDTVYPFADEDTKSNQKWEEKWVIVDTYGDYLTTIMLEHQGGSVYEVLEPFSNRLQKEKIAAVRLVSANHHGLTVSDMNKHKSLRPFLEKIGWKFRTDGKIK